MSPSDQERDECVENALREYFSHGMIPECTWDDETFNLIDEIIRFSESTQPDGGVQPT